MNDAQRSIAARLLALGRQIDDRDLFPTLVPEAADLALANPYASCLATEVTATTAKPALTGLIRVSWLADAGRLCSFRCDLIRCCRLGGY